MRKRKLQFFMFERCKDKNVREAVSGLLKLKDFKKIFE